MTLRLEDVAPLSGPRPRGVRRARHREAKHDDVGRRQVLKVGAAAGVGLGMSLLGLLPPAHEAAADGYDLYHACPSYASPHDCMPGCGPSLVNRWACSIRYHKSGVAEGNTRYSLRPNQCLGGWSDGWVWSYSGACMGCGGGVTFSCQDGYTITPAGTTKTICRWRTDCR